MEVNNSANTGISIQVSLSGYSFNGEWLGGEKVFSTPEFQKRYPSVEISLLTPKFTLVPDRFFTPEKEREILGKVCRLGDEDVVESVPVPWYSAQLVFSPTIGESLSAVIARTVLPESGQPARVLPEMYYLLRELGKIGEYNKIAASWRDGFLHLAIATGDNLRLSNVFRAPDFTTAQYFIFLSLHQLQLNPQLSTVCFRTPLEKQDVLSLYRYVKGVVQL